MAATYLHEHKDFPDLLRIIENETGILAGLVEKDYWIMQVLYGLKKQGFQFELKGGTSLSKGYKIIDRFSEDIDIHIKPPEAMGINENPKNTKPANVEARKKFYDYLASEIKIDGIREIKRDHDFDDPQYYRSGGIRLLYDSKTDTVEGVKEGILLEAGFDNVTPNTNLEISSWALDKAIKNPKLELIDNRATGIACYNPGYTFVEKLQTIATKFRQEQTDKVARPNIMRQYYDVACLLKTKEIQEFIGTDDYKVHKEERFPKADRDIPVAENEAFLLNDKAMREEYKKRYIATAKLYYKGQPDFDGLLASIKESIGNL
jgi:hypothetical protein